MAKHGDESRNGSGGGPAAPGDGGIGFLTGAQGGPIAYRNNEVITAGGDAALAVARQVAPDTAIAEELGPFVRLVGIADPVAVVRRLRSEGFMAQPNHVHFHHALTAAPVYGNPVYGNPVYGNPVYGNPVYGNPVYGNPVYGNPVYGNPVYGNPVYGNPVPGNPHEGRGHMWSTASPVAPSEYTGELARRLDASNAADAPQLFVLDTGLAADAFRPPALASVTGEAVDVPDSNQDGFLDPAAGHGSFIAGLIGQIAPGCSVEVHRVLSGFGDGHEWDIAKCLHALVSRCTPRTIVNISFGAYVLEGAHLMEWAVGELGEKTGAVIVASAGNDATCRPVYPAALPGVVGVGALAADGPAAFTNYGPWVDVCAPGVGIVSTFFTDFDSRVPVGPDGVERYDAYRGWARWSGTSFAAPVVAGNLARMMLLGAPTAQAARRRLVDAPAGMTIPNLGRIVNGL